MRIKGEIIPIDSLERHILKFQETKAMGRAQEWMRKVFGLERGALVLVMEMCIGDRVNFRGTEITVLREQIIERYQIPRPPSKLVLADFLVLHMVCGKNGAKPTPRSKGDICN